MATINTEASEKAISTRAQSEPRDDDQFVLSPRAALYVAFLDAGYTSNDADDLAEYALGLPAKLLEDCKPSAARAWRAERAAIAKAEGR